MCVQRKREALSGTACGGPVAVRCVCLEHFEKNSVHALTVARNVEAVEGLCESLMPHRHHLVKALLRLVAAIEQARGTVNSLRPTVWSYELSMQSCVLVAVLCSWIGLRGQWHSVSNKMHSSSIMQPSSDMEHSPCPPLGYSESLYS